MTKNRRQNMTEEEKIKRKAYMRDRYYNLPGKKEQNKRIIKIGIIQ